MSKSKSYLVTCQVLVTADSFVDAFDIVTQLDSRVKFPEFTSCLVVKEVKEV